MKIVLVDDEVFFCRGIVFILEEMEDMEIVFEVDNG